MAAPYSINYGNSGLGASSVIVPNADTYVVQVRLNIPLFGASSVVTIVQVNSSTKYTSNPGDNSLTFAVACAAGDTINVTTSSSASADQAINAVRANISISQGNI